MSALRTRWITLVVCVLASIPPILLAEGNAFWIALLLPVMGWWVAVQPDSLWPLAWIIVAVMVWFTGSTGSGWHAVLIALSIGAVHMASAVGARSSIRAKGWLRTDIRRVVGYLAVVLVAMGIVGLALLLPPLTGVVWILGAVVLFGSVLTAVRFSVSRH